MAVQIYGRSDLAYSDCSSAQICSDVGWYQHSSRLLAEVQKWWKRTFAAKSAAQRTRVVVQRMAVSEQLLEVRKTAAGPRRQRADQTKEVEEIHSVHIGSAVIRGQHHEPVGEAGARRHCRASLPLRGPFRQQHQPEGGYPLDGRWVQEQAVLQDCRLRVHSWSKDLEPELGVKSSHQSWRPHGFARVTLLAEPWGRLEAVELQQEHGVAGLCNMLDPI